MEGDMLFRFGSLEKDYLRSVKEESGVSWEIKKIKEKFLESDLPDSNQRPKDF